MLIYVMNIYELLWDIDRSSNLSQDMNDQCIKLSSLICRVRCHLIEWNPVVFRCRGMTIGIDLLRKDKGGNPEVPPVNPGVTSYRVTIRNRTRSVRERPAVTKPLSYGHGISLTEPFSVTCPWFSDVLSDCALSSIESQLRGCERVREAPLQLPAKMTRQTHQIWHILPAEVYNRS